MDNNFFINFDRAKEQKYFNHKKRSLKEGCKLLSGQLLRKLSSKLSNKFSNKLLIPSLTLFKSNFCWPGDKKGYSLSSVIMYLCMNIIRGFLQN